MGAMASQITSLTIVYYRLFKAQIQKKHPSSASLAFVMGIHRWPVNSPHKGPVARKMFPFDDVIMDILNHRPKLHNVTGYRSLVRNVYPFVVGGDELILPR